MVKYRKEKWTEKERTKLKILYIKDNLKIINFRDSEKLSKKTKYWREHFYKEKKTEIFKYLINKMTLFLKDIMKIIWFKGK